MKKFEYRKEVVYVQVITVEYLNALGQEGWELIQIGTGDQYGFGTPVWFKREIE